MKKRSIIIIVALLLTSMTLTGCKKITEVKEQAVLGEVTRVMYISAYTSFIYIPNGKSMTQIPQFHPAEHLVTITYKNISKTVDNYALYKKVKVGDVVEVTLVSGYTADHQLVKQYLQF